LRKLFIIFFLFSFQSFGQVVNIDSLEKTLPTQNDSLRAITLTELMWQLRNSDVEKSIQYGLEGLIIIKKHNYVKLKPKILNFLGIGYRNQGNYQEALKYFIETVKASEVVGNSEQVAYAYQCIGDVNGRIGNNNSAELYILKGLTMFRSLGNKRGIAYCYFSLALIHINKKEYFAAYEYMEKALTIREKIKDFSGMAACYSQLGIICQKQNKEVEGLAFLKKAAIIFSKTNDIRGEALVKYNMSVIYLHQKNYSEALKSVEVALKIAEKSGNLEYIKQCYHQISVIYAGAKDFENAYKYQTEFLVYGDSLFNQQKNRQFIELREKFNSEKSALEIQTLTEKSKLQTIILASSFVLIIILVLFIIYFSKNITQRREANLKLEAQTKHIQIQNFSLTRLNEEVLQRNEIVEMQNMELKRLSQIQNKLFSIISHDFKNPLVSLYGSLFIFESNEFSDEDRKVVLDALKIEFEQTSNLLDNLLHWSLGQMKEGKVNLTDFDFLEIINETFALLHPQADKKNIQLINYYQKPLMVHADKEMLTIVLRNLLHNALKYSYNRSIINVLAIPTTDNKDMMTISVKDFGKGISVKNQEKLFGLDHYSSKGTAQEKGSGFGLLLCKDFIEKNGGKIWVYSEIDKGASFYFTVKLAKEVTV
jgi:signal transduction histidine kinase